MTQGLPPEIAPFLVPLAAPTEIEVAEGRGLARWSDARRHVQLRWVRHEQGLWLALSGVPLTRPLQWREVTVEELGRLLPQLLRAVLPSG
jgi:hypothetical protein